MSLLRRKKVKKALKVLHKAVTINYIVLLNYIHCSILFKDFPPSFKVFFKYFLESFAFMQLA